MISRAIFRYALHAWKAALFAAMLTATSGPSLAAPLSYRELLSRPLPAATKRIAYGAAPHQFGDLYLPAAPGPHRVVVLIHGGCWLASLPGVELMAQAADDLRQSGNAVWNIEYRRLGENGGGYPGTFEDVASALDHLRTLAKAYALDLTNVIVAGHSAGGHLAFWSAARSKIAAASRLRLAKPLPVRGAISLAGILDLAAYRSQGPAACGGPQTIDQLVGAATRASNEIFADTSPASLLPIAVPQAVLSGALDPIVPARFGRDYAVAARTAGDRVQETTVAEAGHFELIDPRSAAFETVRSAIAQLQR
jgi:acetyl esterase/lipase